MKELFDNKENIINFICEVIFYILYNKTFNLRERKVY